MADQNQYFETEAERDAAVKAAIIAYGMPYNEVSITVMNRHYIVGKPPATAPVAPAKSGVPEIEQCQEESFELKEYFYSFVNVLADFEETRFADKLYDTCQISFLLLVFYVCFSRIWRK